MATAKCSVSNMEDFLLSGAPEQLKFLLLSGTGSKTGKFQSSWSDNLFEFLGKVLEISYVALLRDKESSSEDESDDEDTVAEKKATRGSKQHELDKKAIAGLLQIVKLRERQKLLFSLDVTNSDDLKSFSDSIREITQDGYKASDAKSDVKAKKCLKYENDDEEDKNLKFVVKQEKEVDNEEKPQVKKIEIKTEKCKETARTADIKVEKQLDTKTVKKLPVKVEIKKEKITPERPSSITTSSVSEHTPRRIPGTKPVSSQSVVVPDIPIQNSLLAQATHLSTREDLYSTLGNFLEQVKEKKPTTNNTTNVYAPTNVHTPTNYYSSTNVYSPTIRLNQSTTEQFIPQGTYRRSPSPVRYQFISPQPTPFLTPEPSPKTPSVAEKPGYTYVQEHFRQGHHVQGHWRGDTWVNGYYRQGHTVKGHYRKK